MTTTTTFDYEAALREYMLAVAQAVESKKIKDERVERERGRKYDKIILVGPIQTFVHSFVDRATGDVIKAAGWRAPQRNADGGLAVRYSLKNLDEWKNLIDPYGGYLYQR